MSNKIKARCIGAFIALGMACFAAYHSVMALHAYASGWPFWVCCVLGIAGPFGLMSLFVFGMGIDNFFFEGFVVWIICGSMIAGLAFTFVDAHEKHLRATHLKQLRLQQKQQKQPRSTPQIALQR